MNITKKAIIDCLEYAILFLLVTYWFSADLGTGVQRIILLFLLGLLWLLKKKFYCHKNTILILGLLFTGQVCAILFGSFDFKLDFGNITTLFLCFGIASLVSIDEFIDRYSNLMCFLCIFSLITFVLYKIHPHIFYSLPITQATVQVHNAFFSLLPINMWDYYRNFGCFGEPGMYAAYLIFALVFETYYNNKPRINRILILSFGILTTFSTAGYLAMFVCIGGFLLDLLYNKKAEISKKKRQQLVVFFFLVIAVVTYIFISGYLVPPTYVFKKLTELASGSGSAFERMRAVQLAFRIGKQYFPFGAGSGVYSDIYLKGIILTVTPLNWFAIYGLLYGSIMNCGIWLFLKKNGQKSLIFRVGSYISVMIVLVSQDISGGIMVLIIYYAYTKKLPEIIRMKQKNLYRRTGIHVEKARGF